MKIIFLDFDGVITTLKSNWKLDNEKMDMIKNICDETGAKIVISSSWRRYNLEQTLISLEKEIPKFILSEYVIGVTDRCYGFKYGNAEKHISIERGNEIKIWIDEYEKENEYLDSYIILDDDCDMLLSQKNNFIKTHPLFGINRNMVFRAIKILNKKEK